MHILFVIPYVPTPIRVRPYSLLNALMALGHDVTLATLWSTQEELDQVKAWQALGIRVEAEPLPRMRSMWNSICTLPTSVPLQAVFCWQPKLASMLSRLLKREKFDVIHVEHLRGARYGLALKNAGTPIVWDSVDCISHLFEQASSHSKSLFSQWMTRLELGRTRQYEGWLLSQFDAVLVTSKVDKQALLALAEQNGHQTVLADQVTVLPNGVDQRTFLPNQQPRETMSLVFSGKMSYHANVTTAFHLLQDIMPLIWEECPDVKVSIVGKDPPTAIQNLSSDERVIITGFVPEISPYLQQATVAVAPLAYGAGIQNKILEAMACATPVVTMTRAISALSIEPEHDILVADSTEGFARQVVRLLKDPALRQKIGMNGYQYVKANHDWLRIGADLVGIYQAL